MKPERLFVILPAALVALVASTFLLILPQGCSTTRDLDPAGVYAGDRPLYEADRAILEAKDAFGMILEWAARNAGYIASDESAAEFVASVRDNRKQWLRDAIAARDAYELIRGPEQLSTLDGKLAILTRALALYRTHATQTLENAN